MKPKEKVEVGSVMRFLSFYKINYTSNDLRQGEENDSVDVYFDRLDLKFQVTTEDGSLIKLVRDKHHNSGTNADEATSKFIINPILKKIEKYRGISTDDITLLISTIDLCPLNWILPKKGSKEENDLVDLYKRANFKDIYLIKQISNDIICLYKK